MVFYRIYLFEGMNVTHLNPWRLSTDNESSFADSPRQKTVITIKKISGLQSLAKF